jgi:hypothetical protein
MAKDRMAATGQIDQTDLEKPGEQTPTPPPPKDANAGEWNKIMTAPPLAANGQPYTHAAWASVMQRLMSNPEQGVKDFDAKFGRAGYSGQEFLDRLKKQSAAENPSLNEPYPLIGAAP